MSLGSAVQAALRLKMNAETRGIIFAFYFNFQRFIDKIMINYIYTNIVTLLSWLERKEEFSLKTKLSWGILWWACRPCGYGREFLKLWNTSHVSHWDYFMLRKTSSQRTKHKGKFVSGSSGGQNGFSVGRGHINTVEQLSKNWLLCFWPL